MTDFTVVITKEHYEKSLEEIKLCNDSPNFCTHYCAVCIIGYALNREVLPKLNPPANSEFRVGGRYARVVSKNEVDEMNPQIQRYFSHDGNALIKEFDHADHGKALLMLPFILELIERPLPE